MAVRIGVLTQVLMDYTLRLLEEWYFSRLHDKFFLVVRPARRTLRR
jgi:hypothetical protein